MVLLMLQRQASADRIDLLVQSVNSSGVIMLSTSIKKGEPLILKLSKVFVYESTCFYLNFFLALASSR